MTVVNRVYITDELLQSLGNVNIPNIDLAHNPMYNSSRDEYNVMYSSFYNNHNVVSISNICNGITYMGTDPSRWDSGTFAQCENLVNVPNISECRYLDTDGFLFAYCQNLVNAPTYPNSVTNMSYHFEGCIRLVNAPVIPNSVSGMERTFAYCTSLVNAPVIPNSVSKLYETFSGCTNLVNAPVIPDDIWKMQGTFKGCSNLVNAPVIPDDIENLDETFSNCTSLVNAPNISNCVYLTQMHRTFAECSSLSNISDLPPSLRDINETFIGCSNLTSAPAIPSSVVNMIETFENCNNIVRILGDGIPNNVEDMSMTFIGCYNLSGDIKINSEKVVSAFDCFAWTSANKNVLIPMTMTQSMDYTKWYCWKSPDGFDTFYTREDFDSQVQMNPWQWLYCYTVYDEDKEILSNGQIQWNPNDKCYYISYEKDGSWYNYEIWYDSSNNVTIHKVAGDTSFTYDSFVEAGYSTSVVKDGVLLKDINDRGTIAFQITPSTGNSIYVDGILLTGNDIEVASGAHNYMIVNPNYPTYYGSITAIKDDEVWVNVDLTQITGYNITINTSEPNCTVTINGETATAVTSTQYVSKSLYSESSREINYSVEKSGYYTESGSVVFNNANVSLNITLVSSDIDLTNWSYTTDEWGNVTLEDYIGPDVETLVIPNTRN